MKEGNKLKKKKKKKVPLQLFSTSLKKFFFTFFVSRFFGGTFCGFLLFFQLQRTKLFFRSRNFFFGPIFEAENNLFLPESGKDIFRRRPGFEPVMI